MNDEKLIHIIPYVVSFLISASVSALSFRRRGVKGAFPFSLVALSQAFWTFGYIFELLSPGIREKIFWDNIQNFGTAGWPFAFLAFALQYTESKLKHPRFTWGVLAATAVAYLALTFIDIDNKIIKLNPLLIDGHPFSELTYDFSIYTKIMIIYMITVIMIGNAILLIKLFSPHRLYRAQVGVIIIGNLIPLFGILTVLLKIQISFHRDLTPLTFAISNIIIYLGLFRFKLFEIIPIGRETVIDNTKDMIVVLDAQNRLVDVNKAALNFLDKKSRQIIGEPISEALPEWAAMIRQFSPEIETQTEITFGEGDLKKVHELNLIPLRDGVGDNKGLLILMREVTKQKQAEQILRDTHTELERMVTSRTQELLDANRALEKEIVERKAVENALRESEEKYRTLFESAPESIVILGLNGEFLDNNEYLGFKKSDIRGKNVRDMKNVISADEVQKTMKHFAKLLKGEKITPIELKINIGDKKELWIESHACLLKKDGHPYALQVISRDITDRKKLEEQFLQSQKMEAIGRLAGGVAHDFNNQLTVILTLCELLQKDFNPIDPVYKKIEYIKNAGEKSASLTKQLLAFSRKQIVEPRVIDVNEAIAKLDNILTRLIGEDIEPAFILNASPSLVRIDPVQFEQVIFNICVNARDAMIEGGKLTIETANIALDEEYVKTHISISPGEYILMAISDSGAGIEKETLNHIFEPFFTTKDRDKGTGLGLSTVYGIIKQADGDIQVYSEPGTGSTFKIYLPKASNEFEDALPEKSAEILENKTEKISGIILVVEDNDSVREIVIRVLKEKGYTLLEAGSGEQALEIIDKHRGALDLFITDVILPGMSGKQLAEKLGEIRPGVKSLFISGYTDNVILHHGVLDEGINFLQKPFTAGALLKKVHSILNK